MLGGGSLKGTLSAMESRTMQAVMPQFATLDVHLPATVLVLPAQPPKFKLTWPPAVAQISLNHSRELSDATAVLFSIGIAGTYPTSFLEISPIVCTPQIWRE